MLSFQEIILRLTQFWEEKQCIIHQGHDLEVGAGTFNPATFLRCLGPEPYRTAYVEPSRRPKDARFGENPNRIQLFHQFQVIMKPSPSDIQQLYLDSLKALDFDLKKHDIRFVHDDWESPTLGAWGLGWEVWCDGMEITQFTYFQSIGSIPLRPVSAEITYGLERLAMFIQNKESIFDVKWNDTLTFGEIIHRSEVEWSKYNFNEASTQMWFKHFEDFEKEAKSLIGKHLPLPAYDFVMKASHAFNILDARGVISVTERTGYIGRIRDLARLVAMEYVASREEMGFPLLSSQVKPSAVKPLIVKPITRFNPKKSEDFLLEIGSEQLPATFVPIGAAHLEKAITKLLNDHNLNYTKIEVFGTPQRLAVLVKNLAEGTDSKQIERKGPPVASSFDTHGKLTEQGKGFLKSIGHKAVDLSDIRQNKTSLLRIQLIKEVEYLFATIEEKGVSTFNILAEALPKLITSLDFPKKMRWADLDISYARPIHWIIALLGSKVVPFEIANIRSDRFSKGHAQLNCKKFPLKEAKEYVSTLKKNYVLASIEERKKSIIRQLRSIEKKIKGKVLEENRVLSQVLHLTEWPQLTYAEFDPLYLKAPKEILILEMIEHQKYFPVADASGNLKNLFIITADNKPNPLIRKGNQKVLSARLADGVFLYELDLQTSLETFNEKLKEMTYQKELGSMMDKVERIGAISSIVREELNLADPKKVARAALLCKADLASSLVGEFPELQGTIGRYYALSQKENPEVAEGIQEHWMPRSENGTLPQTPTGIVVSIADKFDNLIGSYSIGLKPSSSSDPYALRRQTIGIIKILISQKISTNLKKILERSSSFFPSLTADLSKRNTIASEILHFITTRVKGVFEDFGFKKDEIEASLQTICFDPYDQFCKTQALHDFRKSEDFSKLFEVYKRAKGQLQKSSSFAFDPKLCQEKAEIHLVETLREIDKSWEKVLQDRNYHRAFELIAKIQKPLADLFDKVKILCDDPKLQHNRIALLQKVFSYFAPLLDFQHIQEGN